MELSTIDKNRMTVAFLATAIALPLIFIASGRSSDATERPVAQVTTTTYDLGLTLDSEVDAPANLEGPVSVDQNGQGQVAYPADNSGRMVRGTATYRRFPDSAKTACATNLVPLGTTITVRNLNIGAISTSFDITLHTSVFEAIAELIDAPLPIELTW
jgi:hypothetical protein